MKRVYICSPLRGDVEANIEKAKGYCREAAERGEMPLAPHVYFTQFLDDDIPQERETGLEMGLELLALCDEVHVYGETVSEGMAREIALAGELGLPVIYKEGMILENEETNHFNCADAGYRMEL
jgi:hypothetical protein